MNQPHRIFVPSPNATSEELKCFGRGILFGYKLVFTGDSFAVISDKYSIVPGTFLSGKLGNDKENKLQVWDMERRDSKPAIIPSGYSVDCDSLRAFYRCANFPEAVLDAAIEGRSCPHEEFFEWILRGGSIGTHRKAGSFTCWEEWGGEHFVISPMPRSPRDRDDIAYIQRNREECRRLVDFMYFMKHFAYTEDDPMRYRYVIGMLGETCSEYANAPYTVLCEKLIARATELLK